MFDGFLGLFEVILRSFFQFWTLDFSIFQNRSETVSKIPPNHPKIIPKPSQICFKIFDVFENSRFVLVVVVVVVVVVVRKFSKKCRKKSKFSKVLGRIWDGLGVILGWFGSIFGTISKTRKFEGLRIEKLSFKWPQTNLKWPMFDGFFV